LSYTHHVEERGPVEPNNYSGNQLARDSLGAASIGRWLGPVRSTYGLHLVRVDAREEGQAVTLADVRDEVERDVRDARSRAASDALYERLRARYSIRIEKPVHGLEDAAALASQTP